MRGKWFNVLQLVVLENHGWSQVQSMKVVDYITKYGIVFSNWIATAHPSGPNYRTLMSGNYWSYNEFDGVKRANIGDHVTVAVENFKGVPADRHNPFKDMQSIMLRAFTPVDINEGIWYHGMDDMNDAHSASLDIADSNTMELINNFMSIPHSATSERDLLFIVFDEAFGGDYLSNHVFAGMLGNFAFPSGLKTIHSPIRHEMFAQFLYDNWGLASPEEMLPTGKTYAGQALFDLV